MQVCQRSSLKVCIISCSTGSGPGGENALHELWSIKDMILCFQISCLNPSSSTSIFPNFKILAVNLEQFAGQKVVGAKALSLNPPLLNTESFQRSRRFLTGNSKEKLVFIYVAP